MGNDLRCQRVDPEARVNRDGETDGVTGQDRQETGREGECVGTEPEAATGFLKLGKILREIRSNSRVCKKLISMRGSNWGWTGREKG